MRKPVIGVTPQYDDKTDSIKMLPQYMNAVRFGGGIPVILPFSDSADEIGSLADLFDGFLFTGGHDIDPAMYDEEKLPCCQSTCAQRDRLEAILFSEVLNRNKPILGICRGSQFINVMLGGSLYQDIGTQTAPDTTVVHAQGKPYDTPVHSIRLLPGTPVYALAGTDEIWVNSLHHQAVKRLAGGLLPAAFSPDGIVEAAYMPDRAFVVGVQWHPEFTFDKGPVSAALFRAFIEASS